MGRADVQAKLLIKASYEDLGFNVGSGFGKIKEMIIVSNISKCGLLMSAQ